MKSSLDTAFMRCLRFIVKFPFTGLTERKRIWARAFLSHCGPNELGRRIAGALY